MITYIDMGHLVFHYVYRQDQWDTDKYLYSKHSNYVLVNEGYPYHRSEIFPQYKQSEARVKNKSGNYVIEAKKLWANIVESNLHNIIFKKGLEADDLLAIEAYRGNNIVTNDKDLLQIPNISVQTIEGKELNIKAGLPKSLQDIELTPEQHLLVLCLFGDTADNIPRLIDKGKKAIKESRKLFESNNPWIESYHLYGDDLLRNLYLTILPYPGIFQLSENDVYRLVKTNQWHTFVREKIQKIESIIY